MLIWLLIYLSRLQYFKYTLQMYSKISNPNINYREVQMTVVSWVSEMTIIRPVICQRLQHNRQMNRQTISFRQTHRSRRLLLLVLRLQRWKRMRKKMYLLKSGTFLLIWRWRMLVIEFHLFREMRYPKGAIFGVEYNIFASLF